MAKKKRRPLTRERVARWLENRFFLRFHMTLILVATFLAGLGATKLLLAVGFESMAVRYLLAVVAAYLAFLALIRLWLFYVNADRSVDFGGDAIDISFHVGDVSGDVIAPQLGGGSFGGGGATGSWGDAVAAPVKSSGGGGGGFGLDLDLDLDGLIVVVLFLALCGAIFFAGLYVIYTAPALMSEAAFEALLAGALLRRAKKIDRVGWVGKVWKATFWPFFAVLVLAGALGWFAQKRCPDAVTLRGAIQCPSRLISSPPP